MVVLDKSVIVGFLQNGLVGLEELLRDELVVSSVTVQLVELELVQSGARPSEVREDLAAFGFQVVELNDRLAARSLVFREQVKGLSFDSAVALAVAEFRKLGLVSGEKRLVGQGLGVTVQVLG